MTLCVCVCVCVHVHIVYVLGWVILVGIATRYRLDGPEIESR